MAKDVFDKYGLSFHNVDDFIEFIIEHLDTSGFEDSYVDAGGFGDPNEMFKCSIDDKVEAIQNCLLELINGD